MQPGKAIGGESFLLRRGQGERLRGNRRRQREETDYQTHKLHILELSLHGSALDAHCKAGLERAAPFGEAAERRYQYQSDLVIFRLSYRGISLALQESAAAPFPS